MNLLLVRLSCWLQIGVAKNKRKSAQISQVPDSSANALGYIYNKRALCLALGLAVAMALAI